MVVNHSAHLHVHVASVGPAHNDCPSGIHKDVGVSSYGITVALLTAMCMQYVQQIASGEVHKFACKVDMTYKYE